MRYRIEDMTKPDITLKIKKRYRHLRNTGNLRKSIVGFRKYESIEEVAQKQRKSAQEKLLEGIALNRADIFKTMPHCEEVYPIRQRECKLSARMINQRKEASIEKRRMAIQDIEDAKRYDAKSIPEKRIRLKAEERPGLDDYYNAIVRQERIQIMMMEYRVAKERTETLEKLIRATLKEIDRDIDYGVFQHLVDYGVNRFIEYWAVNYIECKETCDRYCTFLKTTYIKVVKNIRRFRPKYEWLSGFRNRAAVFNKYMPITYEEFNSGMR